MNIFFNVKKAFFNHFEKPKTTSSEFNFQKYLLLPTAEMVSLNLNRATYEKLWEIKETKENVQALRQLKLINAIYLWKSSENAESELQSDVTEQLYNPEKLKDVSEQFCCDLFHNSKEINYLIQLNRFNCSRKTILKIESLLKQDLIPAELKGVRTFLNKEEESFSKQETLSEKLPDLSELEKYFKREYSLLKMHDQQALKDVFQALWQQHSTTHFFDLSYYYFVPHLKESLYPFAESFEGFYRAIQAKKQTNLEILSGFTLADEHVQTLIKLLKTVAIKYLHVFLRSDIKPDTMQQLFDALCEPSFVKTNKKCYLQLDLTHFDDEEKSEVQTAKEELSQTEEIFNNMIQKLSSLGLYSPIFEQEESSL